MKTDILPPVPLGCLDDLFNCQSKGEPPIRLISKILLKLVFGNKLKQIGTQTLFQQSFQFNPRAPVQKGQTVNKLYQIANVGGRQATTTSEATYESNKKDINKRINDNNPRNIIVFIKSFKIIVQTGKMMRQCSQNFGCVTQKSLQLSEAIS